MTPHELRSLPGGVRLVTAPMTDRASASIVLMFGVGSRYEDDRRGGVSHFLEHLLFKGTEKRPTAEAIAEAIEGVGGVMNASTDKELTLYWARVPAERLALAVDVLFDMVVGSKLLAEEIERERSVILEELKMYQDQPQDYVHNLFEQIVWPGHPLGRDIGGTLDSVAQITREELVSHLRDNYGRQRMVVGVSGGIDPDHAQAEVESAIANLPPAQPLDPAGAPGSVTTPTVLLHEKKTEQAHICLGVPALSYMDEDRHALDLVNAILGEGMSSRLFLEIRERRGLAYDVHSYTSKHRDTGYLGVYVGVDPKKAEEAVAAVIGELRRLASDGVGETELNKVKEYTKGRLRLGLESTNAVAHWLSQQELLMGVIRTQDEIVAAIDAVTGEQIARVARSVLGGAVQLTVIGPFKSDAGFRRAIEG